MARLGETLYSFSAGFLSSDWPFPSEMECRSVNAAAQECLIADDFIL
jgi:hypothetical protein